MGDCRRSGQVRRGMRRGHAVSAVFLILVLFILPVSASVYMYTGTGNDTIQDLINRTSNGDSIYVVPGTYYENLVIDRGIVFGALDTSDPPVIVTSGSGPGITLAADGITLNGLNITGSARTGLLLQSSNNRISDITIQGLERGVELVAASNNIISKNAIQGNSLGIIIDRSSRTNTFLLNGFDNTLDVSGQASDNKWFTTSQDYTYRGNSFTGPLGNFWKAYNGTDSNGNGVGDTAYLIPVAGIATASTGTDTTDRAPLISPPVDYTLLVRNVSSVNASDTDRSERPPDLFNDRQQLQQQLQQDQKIQQPPQGQTPLSSENPGDQTPFSGDAPGSLPVKTTTPPSGVNMLPRLLIDFWWLILIVVIVSIVGGIWFERGRRKGLHPATGTPAPGGTTPNATVVRKPGTTIVPAEDTWQDGYYTARLPSALERKYPGAEYLGEGGVGRVFRAWDAGENRPVAVKIPIRFDEVTGTQFTKELHIWQGLHHNNIVEIYAANVFPMPYIEMEYVDSSLASLKFPLGIDRALKIITGVAEGLRYAHDQGIVHRDIKPENILITADDVPKITDWGLAKALSDPKQTGLISFSLNYAAPEQLAPNIYGEAGKWTDIYQLGVLLYEMLSGRLPFSGEGMGEVSQAILHNAPRPLEFTGRNAEEIWTIIARCLQKRPEDRYATVAEILDDLHRLA